MWPNRVSRLDLGPELENTFPVTNPKKEQGAEVYNLAWWVAAGLARVSPRAVLVCSVAGGVVTTEQQMLAWDPNGALSVLTWVYQATGNYDLDFAAQYPDHTGTNRNLVLLAGMASVSDTVDELDHRARVIVTAPNSITVRVFDAATLGTPIDRDFIVTLW